MKGQKSPGWNTVSARIKPAETHKELTLPATLFLDPTEEYLSWNWIVSKAWFNIEDSIKYSKIGYSNTSI